MPLQPKTRVITFRLTDEEYSQIKTLCRANGGRSVSELTRLALESVLHDGIASPESQLHDKVRQLDDRLSSLDRKLEDLCQLVNRNAFQAVK